VRAAAAVVFIFIMLGVAYFVVGQLEAHGLPWPGFLNILLLLVALASSSESWCGFGSG
jgi:membrane-bound ClpP family serine protease